MRKLSLGALVLVFALPLAVALDDAATPSPSSAAGATTTSRTATIAYPGCPHGAVTLTVTVPRAPVPSGVPVRPMLTLRNTGPQTCGPPSATTTLTRGDGRARLELFGQCGTFPVVIEDHGGERVYPPFEAVLCPDTVAPKLAPGAVVTDSLSWNQREGGGRPARRARTAPPGVYRVAIDGTTRATFVLAPRRGAARTPARKSPARGPRHPTVAATVTRSGHIAFEGCSPKEIVATVTAPARAVVGKEVTYTVALHNRSALPCGARENAVGPGKQELTVGPCGIVPAVVRNASGVNIYPGPVAFSCPMEAFIDIPAHDTVTATGTWPGSRALGPAPPHVSAAPPGRYRIVVGAPPSVVSVPLTLVATPASSTGHQPNG